MTPTYLVARIGKPHGLRGEVTVQLHTDSPQTRLLAGASFDTDPHRGAPLRICSVRVHQGTYLLGFDGVQDRSAAEELRGTRLSSPLIDDAEGVTGAEDQLDDGWRPDDLVGFEVSLANGEVVGTVSGLHTRAVQDLLVIRLTDGREALVPFVEQIVPVIEQDQRRVVLDPPPGLLDPGLTGT